MIVAVSIALRLGGIAGGVLGGAVAVLLARVIPPRMDRETRARPQLWWVTAIVVGAAFGWQAAAASGGWALLPAYLTFGATTLAVTLTDLDHRLIPDRILFPGLGVTAVLLVIGAVIDGSAVGLSRAGMAAMVYFMLLLGVATLVRGGFGGGDIKLALLLGLLLGFVGWGPVAVAFVAGILLGGVAAIAILVFTDQGRKAKFAYGPYLVLGAWIALFWGQEIANWYFRSGG